MHSKPSLIFFTILNLASANAQRNGNNGNGGNVPAGGLTLNTANVQKASASDGDPNQAAGQSASQTDDANFINFCNGKQLTNGAQVTGGSCNGIVMGDMPAQGSMVSSIIINPAPGQNIAANTEFNIQVQISNLVAGVFTNPQDTYYAAPQALKGGKVVGHCHVTVQDLGNSISPKNPPNAATFAFFKGIDDAGNGNGLLSATVTGGLPAGNYRVCTMNSASNHQPVLMPVAQRGAQDDCTKFTVGGNGSNNNNNNNGNKAAGSDGGNPNAGISGGNAGNQQSSRVSTTTTATRAANSANSNGDGGRQQGGQASSSFTTMSAARATSSNNGNNGMGRNGAQSVRTTTAFARAATTSGMSGANNANSSNGGGHRSMSDRRRHRFQSREYIVI